MTVRADSNGNQQPAQGGFQVPPRGSGGSGPSTDRRFATYQDGYVWGPVAVPAAPFRGSADASERWAADWTNSQNNAWMPQSSADEMFNDLPDWQQAMFNSIAAASTAGTDSGASVYRRYVSRAGEYAQQGTRVTPAELALKDFESGDIVGRKSGDGDGNGGSRYSGMGTPAANPDTIRKAMNQVTMGLLGRQLSEREFQQYYGQYKAEFAATGGNMDVEQGLIDRARQDEGYQEYQVATKFASALDSVLKGAA